MPSFTHAARLDDQRSRGAYSLNTDMAVAQPESQGPDSYDGMWDDERSEVSARSKLIVESLVYEIKMRA